jgi:hypothetical protein
VADLEHTADSLVMALSVVGPMQVLSRDDDRQCEVKVSLSLCSLLLLLSDYTRRLLTFGELASD